MGYWHPGAMKKLYSLEQEVISRTEDFVKKFEEKGLGFDKVSKFEYSGLDLDI